MEPQGRPSRGRQVATDVSTIGSANRVVDDYLMPTNSNLDKRFSIERLKPLGATTFEGTTDPADVEKWLNLIEKCFGVMNYPEERKVKASRRNEFMSFIQSDMSVDEYESRFTKLAKNALAFVIDEIDKCKRFEQGLKGEIRTSVMASMNWLDFAKLVEATMRVESNLA
ncbi:uncharacterized protein E5676_scaffold275G00720 [Cucumis melo var. makuwa]|uniref:Retrotransposon gag domain-containing protein n=1 Tax=Cucumis melo var. makuwa TaxID=1194695 RepID=A0A5D3DDC6_CUCMM|nr:uncharacterized protein E5676_scaffold275G00720 [Cucumis melo var. makuwa]